MGVVLKTTLQIGQSTIMNSRRANMSNTTTVDIKVKRVIRNLYTEGLTATQIVSALKPIQPMTKGQVAAIKAHFTMRTYR